MLQIGTTIHNGTYRIIEDIGEGGGGKVYKAYHNNLRKYVAIKLLLEKAKHSFQGNRSEADIMKELKHPNLPIVYDYVEEGGDIYSVMEYIEGENFETLTNGRNKRAFSEKDVCRYMMQLCDAVSYLHSRKPPIIHSDIKPSNIMLTKDDNICLIDFNISVFADGGRAIAAGYDSKFVDIALYKQVIQEPAQVQNFHEQTRFMRYDRSEITDGSNTQSSRTAFVDWLTDIFGIGATMYYLITGITPKNGVVNINEGGLSRYTKRIIRKATNPDPSKRYKNAFEMKSDLLDISGKVSASPRRTNSHKTLSSKQKAGIVLLAVSIFIGISSFVLLANSDQDEEPKENFEPTAAFSEVSKALPETVIADLIVPSATIPDKVRSETLSVWDSETYSVVTPEEQISVPRLINMDIDDARVLLNSVGLTYDTEYHYDDRVEANCIYKQSIASGTKVNAGTAIILYVNTGKTEQTAATTTAMTTSNSITSIKLSQKKISLRTDGGPRIITLTIIGEGDYIYSLNDPTVADVEQGDWNGNSRSLIITPYKGGKARLTVYSVEEPSISDHCDITVAKASVQQTEATTSVTTVHEATVHTEMPRETTFTTAQETKAAYEYYTEKPVTTVTSSVTQTDADEDFYYFDTCILMPVGSGFHDYDLGIEGVDSYESYNTDSLAYSGGIFTGVEIGNSGIVLEYEGKKYFIFVTVVPSNVGYSGPVQVSWEEYISNDYVIFYNRNS